jgi:hypothetical protein
MTTTVSNYLRVPDILERRLCVKELVRLMRYDSAAMRCSAMPATLLLCDHDELRCAAYSLLMGEEMPCDGDARAEYSALFVLHAM